MTYQAAWSFDTTALNLADQHMIASPKLMQRAMKRQEGRLKSRFLKIVRVTPPLPKPGITKKMTPRQRRKFWATNGFGHGIPYVRTGKLNAAWDATFSFTEDGGAFAGFNDASSARFVIGYDQQRFHADTGWIYAPRVLDDFVPIVLEAYEATWLVVANPFVA